MSGLSGPATSTQLIEPGDVLEVTIVAGISELGPFVVPVRVGDNGAGALPVIGEVPLAGLELEQAEQLIHAAVMSGGLYRNPHVTVVMKKKRMNRITVIGAVNEPGTYALTRSNCDLLAAFVAAEGLSKDAGTEVEIKSPEIRSFTPQEQRPNLMAGVPGQQVSFNTTVQNTPSQRVRINLVSASRSGQGVMLNDGDVVMVQRRDPNPIKVMGLINKPGEIELPMNRNMRLLDALALSGGLKSPLA
ncbi:MAG: polysaccharide biosynthesis/export family protein, partial [Planctomycetales bacterium]